MIAAAGLDIVKIVGTGNDFLFIDARQALEPGLPPRPELAKNLCDRNFGVGADGLVFVEAGSQGASFKWDFYNSDGSPAEMCGNASRCMGRWAKSVLGLNEVEFETVAGVVRAHVSGAAISVQLDYLSLTFSKLEYEAEGQKRSASFVNTGVPHAVVEVAEISQASRANADIQALRFHPQAGPRGTNVTFLQRLGPDRFATMTFERGVEAFTLSCGTGVLAAAAVGLRATEGLKSARLHAPGGELSASFAVRDEKWSGATLTGPADLVFAARVLREALQR